ncbi:MAG: response regulator [Anaerolineae bacterium]|nr:response regulator [Anaerolineae bacterium]
MTSRPTSSAEPQFQPDFRALFESAPAPYLVLLPDLTIAAVSEAYLRATMTKREEILGRGIFEVFPDNPDDPAATGVGNLRSSLERVLSSRAPDTMAVQKYDVQRPDGSGFEERFWSPINTPVFAADGQVAYIIHHVEDVTEFIKLRQTGSEQQKRADSLQSRTEQMESEIFRRAQELQETNRQLRTLNEEVGRRELEITQLYDRLFQLDQLKTQLFANVSHELRTPLSLILGLTEKMLAGDSGSITGQQHRDLEGVDRNARILLKHVNDLLDVAKLESGKMSANYADTDVAHLVRHTAGHFTSMALEHSINYSIDVPDKLDAQIDPDKIQRVLMNLLSNAFKFTPASGTVSCTMRVESAPDQHDPQLHLTIADSGPGIPAELRANVFERFFQVEGTSSRRFGGTGLGLAIAKDFVELHGGAISIGEAAEGGALITITLPLHAPTGSTVRSATEPTQYSKEFARTVSSSDIVAADEEAVGSQPAADASAPLVLVVEDHAEMSRHIQDTLARDYRTVSAVNGPEGLRKALELRPDLIMSDMMMPGGSGDSMVTEIRSHAELSDVPILMLTAKADDESRIRLLRQGAQDYLLKPFAAEELRARVHNLVALKRAREQLVERNDHLSRINAELDAVNQELDAFSYSVSHDLRAPLRAIDGFAALLGEDLGENLPEEAEFDLKRIRHNVANMQTMINELLALARLGRQSLSKTTVSTADLVRDSLQDLQGEIKGRQVDIRIGELPTTEADAVLLKQVFVNLISNALKYSRKREPAIIEIGTQPASKNNPVTYFVRDNGAGFDMQYADKLFGVFQRLHRAEEFEGTGVGLAIVRRIITRHGGRIWVEAAVDQGAAFFFTLA